MKFKFLAKTIAIVTTFLGMKDIPIDAEEKRSNFSAEDKQKLVGKLGAEKTNEIIGAIDTEIKMMYDNNLDLKAINDELAALVAEHAQENELQEDDDEDDDNEEEEAEKPKSNATNHLAEIKALLSKRDQMIATLLQTPEEDVKPKQNLMRTNNVQHSATHLFASGKSYDAFENRPWNARLRDMSAKATNFKDNAHVPTLIEDMEHFVLEHPEALTSLVAEMRGLPAEWDHKSGVLDMVSEAGIIAGEIVQGRSKGWNAKNKFKIAAEVGKVFRKKIDIELSGYELQEIENTWIRSYNDVGSHPYKMKFVYRLMEELVKQQFLDDRKAQINGIYVETPEGDDYTGMAVNSQNGLLYLFHDYRDVKKKYRAFSLGKPTKENIVDYVKDMIESMPETDRTEDGLEIGLSYEKLQWYRERAGLLYQHMASTDEGKLMYKKNHPIDYPNIIFQPILDMTKTDFMYITKSKNIQTMDYRPEEKHFFTFEFLKRNLYIFADYRLGIRIKQVGVKVNDNQGWDFERQMVWSNDVPIFDEGISVPAFDDGTGILNITYPTVKIDEQFNTNITAIEGAISGQVIKITGNSKLSAERNLVKSTNIDITTNYPLNTDGYILLYVQPDGKFKELTRTTEAPTPVEEKITFSGDVIDASSGNTFYFDGEENATLTSIIDGVAGKSIKIFGTDTAEVALTISSTEDIKVNSSATLDTAAKFVELINVGGVWYETSSNV